MTQTKNYYTKIICTQKKNMPPPPPKKPPPFRARRFRPHLFAGEELVGEDLEQLDRVAVVTPEHLAYDRQQVPDAFGLASPQRAQQALPLGGGWRRARRQVVDVAETRALTVSDSRVFDKFHRRIKARSTPAT